jgi:hypothetical protein
MTFSEILSVQGVSKEQCTAIMKEMARNRIFITKEEKIEERYHKLRQKKDELKCKLDHAVFIIADLKNKSKEMEKLLNSTYTREKVIANLKKEYDSKIVNMIITSAIHKELSNARYPELLIDKFDKTKLSINSEGIVEGIEEQLISFKDNYKELFTTQQRCWEGYPSGLHSPASETEKEVLIPDKMFCQDVRNLEKESQNDLEGRRM